MKPFRKNVALAVDGGGIRGVVVTRALAVLEEHLGKMSGEVFTLVAGTSTGSIISAGIAAGLSGAGMHRLYLELGETVFRRSWRSRLWPLTRYRYPIGPLRAALMRYIGNLYMGTFWWKSPSIDVVITTFDLVTNRTRFIKPWKEEYATWPVVQAVLASSCVPTYFPVVLGRYVDGGVGAYSNPCYIAAYEAQFCLGWNPDETTLISLGTGREPHQFGPGDAARFFAWQWLGPVLGAFLQSADDQQIHLVQTFFDQLDFRRFQVDLVRPIGMDDVGAMSELTQYGEELGRKILNDETEGGDFSVARELRPVHE
ncbi:MAG: patatin-like phospholipase family protein [Chloroflexi bacterium]|nr:patatin-like phospholipase family protein [Chloroflexota bacterium]